MKKFIKIHKYTIILVLIFILIVILGFKVKELLVPDEGKATYGERLKDINKHLINDDVYDKISSEFEKDESVVKIDHRLQGKILNYYITVGDKVSVKDAKAKADKIISLFDDELLNYYTIQVYLIKEDKSLNNFPMIGLKNILSKEISWTKERDITVSEDEK